MIISELSNKTVFCSNGLLPLLPNNYLNFQNIFLFLGPTFLIMHIMKTKFLFQLLVITLFQVSLPAFASTQDNWERIKLRDKIRVESRSTPVLPIAIIDNSLLSIDLLSPVSNVTIIVKNAETDEIVYSSTECDVEKIEINLSGEDMGKYTLDIELPDSSFTGDFEL